MTRVDEYEDPTIGSFLAFLAGDIRKNSEAINMLTPDLAARISTLTEGMDIDLDAGIDGDVSLHARIPYRS